MAPSRLDWRHVNSFLRLLLALWTIRPKLMSVPGVAKVAVSYKDRTATVIYDDAITDVNQLTSATTKAGYPSAPRS